MEKVAKWDHILKGVSHTSTWEAWLQFQNGFSRFTSIIDACAWTRWRLMIYPINKTSITTSRYCYSCFSQAGKEAGERARGRSEKSSLCYVKYIVTHTERGESGGRWWLETPTRGSGTTWGRCLRYLFFFLWENVFELPCDFIQVKLYDKISFTFGVLCICGTEVKSRRII